MGVVVAVISIFVMLNSFQHPSCLPVWAVQAEKWILKRVQDDGGEVSSVPVRRTPASEHPPPLPVWTRARKALEFTMTRRIIAAFAAGIFTLAASACNTVEGAGEDIESVGEEIDEET